MRFNTSRCGSVTCQRVGSETKYPNGADEYLNWTSDVDTLAKFQILSRY